MFKYIFDKLSITVSLVFAVITFGLYAKYQKSRADDLKKQQKILKENINLANKINTELTDIDEKYSEINIEDNREFFNQED